MSFYEDFMKNIKVGLQEPDPNGPKLIHIDEHRCYFEDRPNIIFNTSLTDTSYEHTEEVIKSVAYHTYLGLLKAECIKRGININDVLY